MRHTVRAFIIKDKKLLLVTGHGSDYYWGPGGSVEGDETSLEALHREIKEELSVNIISCSLYRSYKFDDQEVDTYLVTIADKFYIDNEITGFKWYDTSSKIKPGEKFRTLILPDLIADDLVK